ncbi:P450-derived glycosyltransferase activator [Micromonospora sp. NPDC049559]|uniref:cytochrome P450 family protein n=1 Tax=Micromonospora sp. NPDC049559 TaxID=3155923 RepID=UPI003443B7BC
MTPPPAVLGRRIQLIHAAQWLYAADGDGYATIARGFDEDPWPGYARLRTAAPLSRSRTGVWTTTRYATGAALLDDARFARTRADGAATPTQVLTLPELIGTPDEEFDRLAESLAPVLDDAATTRCREWAERAGGRLLDAGPPRCDLVRDVLRPAVVGLLAELLELGAAERARFAEHCAAVEPALDSLVCPQPLDRTRRMLGALRDLGAVPGRRPGVLLAALGAPMATVLATNAVAALFDRPGEWSRVAADPTRAARVVAETRRYDPPVQLDALVARRDLELAGQPLAAGDQVVVVIAAANRDPDAFARPDRFDPDRTETVAPLSPAPPHRLVEPFAVAVAEGLVRALAVHRPQLRPDGPLLRQLRAPVTRRVLRFPVAAGEPDRSIGLP